MKGAKGDESNESKVLSGEERVRVLKGQPLNASADSCNSRADQRPAGLD